MTALNIQHTVLKINGQIVDRSQYRKPFPEDDYQENKVLVDGKERERELRREYMQKYRQDPKNRERLKTMNREYARDPESRQKVKERFRERYKSDPEFRQKVKDYQKEYWNRPENRERHLEQLRKAARKYSIPTSSMRYPNPTDDEIQKLMEELQ